MLISVLITLFFIRGLPLAIHHHLIKLTQCVQSLISGIFAMFMIKASGTSPLALQPIMFLFNSTFQAGKWAGFFWLQLRSCLASSPGSFSTSTKKWSEATGLHFRIFRPNPFYCDTSMVEIKLSLLRLSNLIFDWKRVLRNVGYFQWRNDVISCILLGLLYML